MIDHASGPTRGATSGAGASIIAAKRTERSSFATVSPTTTRRKFLFKNPASLTIKLDPRVKASPAELEAMFKLQTRLARMMTASSEAILQARSIREQLEKLTAQATGAASDAIKALDKKIAAILDGSGEPAAAKPAEKNLKAVNDDIYTLYTAVDRADAAPTPAQEKAASAIEADLRPVMKRWEELKTTDLAALNRQLKSASLPEIRNEIDTHLEEEPAEDLE